MSADLTPAISRFPVPELDALPEDLRATLRAGERWRLPVRLKLPHGTMNPDGFDVELWWWEQGIRATGSVRSGLVEDVASRLDPRAGHIPGAVHLPFWQAATARASIR